MDSLQVVVSGGSKSSSRSASPGRPFSGSHSSHHLSSAPHASRNVTVPHSSNDGSSGSASSVGMSSSTKQRHKSPASSSRRDRDKGSSDGGTPHLARTSEPVFSIGSQEDAVAAHSGTDDDVDIFLSSSPFLSNGSSEHVMASDDVDGQMASSSEVHRTRAAMEHTQNKIGRTKEQIRDEQTARDDNVNEYLKLAANADKQQLQRIKAVFEKKNQKSAQSISQLQKKLESYTRKLRELETYGLPGSHHRQPREVLRDMGQGLKHVGGNIRDGITGFSGTVMSKPREFAHLIKNKFGSADNINTLSRNGDSGSGEEEKTHHGSATLPGNCSLGGGSAHASSSAGAIKIASEEGSACSSVTSESLAQQQSSPHRHHNNSNVFHLASSDYNLEPIFVEMQERREEFERLREELETVKISKMEHQQQQHQQYVTLEGIDNSNARALVVKLINVVLTVLQVVLLLVATAAGIVMPFLRTRLRVLTTCLLVATIVFVLKQWPELRDVSDHIMRHIKETLSK